MHCKSTSAPLCISSFTLLFCACLYPSVLLCTHPDTPVSLCPSMSHCASPLLLFVPPHPFMPLCAPQCPSAPPFTSSLHPLYHSVPFCTSPCPLYTPLCPFTSLCTTPFPSPLHALSTPFWIPICTPYATTAPLYAPHATPYSLASSD